MTEPNHKKLLAALLKGYRAIVVALLTIGVLGLFQTHDLVVRLDERLKNVEFTIINIEKRQYDMQRREPQE